MTEAAPSHLPPSDRAGSVCAVVCAGAFVAGMGSFFVGGGGSLVSDAAGWFMERTAKGMAAAAALATVAVVVAGSLAWGERFFFHAVMPFLLVVLLGMVAAFASMVGLGWLSLLGIPVFAWLPPVGTPTVGAGALLMGIAGSVMAYCRTPLLVISENPEENRKPNAVKARAAVVVALVLIGTPGIATFANNETFTNSRAGTAEPLERTPGH